jgi:hypothetical protein
MPLDRMPLNRILPKPSASLAQSSPVDGSTEMTSEVSEVCEIRLDPPLSDEQLSDRQQWRWATEQDQPQEGSEDELIRQLASGKVPPYALVWKAGWGEWLPAMQVAELAALAFPVASVAGARSARPSSIPGDIPPVPVSEYPRLRLLAKAHPHGLPLHQECPEQEVVTSEVPAAAMLQAARVMTEPSPPANLGLDVAIERASRHPEATLRFMPESGEWSAPPPSRPAPPLAAEFGLQGLIEAGEPKPASSPPWLRAQGLWITLLAICLGLGALFAVRWFAASRRPAAPGAGPAGLGVSSPAAAALPTLAPRELPELACRFEREPVKLDDWAVVDVRPALLVLPGNKSVALGYAQSHRHATGGLLDLETLGFARRFGQTSERQIFSVTPLNASGNVGYHVERMGALVAFGRALDMTPPVRIGMNDDGIVLGRFDARSEKVWELPVGTLISVPEVSAHAQGFTLATRAGRTTGQLRLGLLSASGAALSPLEQIASAEWDYGRPALVSGPSQTVLAATLRTDPARGQSMLLGRASNGRLPLELSPLEIFGAGDVELSAPALAALSDGGFVLMWTQGVGWERQVRVQRLSATLLPLGSPFALTTPDPALGGSVAGAIQSVGERLVAFYFLRREGGHSLWATTVRCGV